MTHRVYHAHAKCTYGKLIEEQERAVIRKTFPGHELIDPGAYEDNVEKQFGGMDFCLKLVESCDAVVFSRIMGQVTAGVGTEVEHAFLLGKPVYELIGDTVRQVFEPPRYVSIEETWDLYDQWENENL